jgi:DNA uptake protein ComE-like DNA-binding protein
MAEPPIVPPSRRQALIGRSEQALLVVLTFAVLAGVVWRVGRHWRIGAEPLEPIPAAAPSYRVDVNAADWVTLALVPGLGETLARRIVAERERRGGRFDSVHDLVAVKGIGEKVLAKLEPYLTASGAADADPDAEPVHMIDPAPTAP